jgi:Zn-dependent protease
VDRQGLLSPAEPSPEITVEPVVPDGDVPVRRRSWRDSLRRLTGPIVFVGSLVLKLGSLAKFAALFVAFGGYTLIWGWRFALGLIVLIFVHEMGHFLEASREHLHPSWPVFVPFLGAYVKHTRGNPWQTARVALAGPIVGGLAALVCFLVGKGDHSSLLVALGYFGFVLNLINLLPIGILDGGSVWRSTRWLWLGGGRPQALVSGSLFVLTAVGLAAGAVAAYVPQHRL